MLKTRGYVSKMRMLLLYAMVWQVFYFSCINIWCYLPGWCRHTALPGCVLACTLAIAYFGRQVYRNAGQALLNGHVNMSVLVASVILLLLVSSIYSLTFVTYSGAMLCMHHIHCPLTVLGSMALRDYMLRYVTAADKKSSSPVLQGCHYNIPC